MVDRVRGPFEYFETTAESIEEAAKEPARHSRTMHGLADDLDLDQKRTRAATEGDIEDLVGRHPNSAAARSRRLAMNGAFATGCLTEFAQGVRAFDTTTARLNREVARAVAAAAKEAARDDDPGMGGETSAGGGISGVIDEVESAVDITNAGAEAYRRLLPQYRRAQAELEDDGERVAGRLERGARAEDVRDLMRAGYIPLIMAGVFTQVQLSPSDKYVALVAGLMRDHLPPEATTWTVKQLDAYLTRHHAAADRVVDGSDDLDSVWSQVASGLSVAGLLKTLGSAPEGDRRRLATMLPSIIGNHKDAPFDLRAQAHRVNISAQIHRDAQRIEDLRADPRYRGGEHGLVDRLEKRAKLYEDLLHKRPQADLSGDRPEHRQIILFDPRGDGRIAEISGVIDRHTKNVGVYLPGTGHGLDDWNSSVRRSNELVANSNGLAMVTWIGGDLPDGVVANAPSRGYADTLAPRLADFSHQLRDEMHRVGSAGDTAYLGHSYASAITGQAERIGLDADRVLSVEGVGMGHGVDDRDDLSTPNRHTPHYSMTAPDDFIGTVQRSGWHGQDPDEFEGTVQLQTGHYKNGEPITGSFASHSGVFSPFSDAWNNMLAFLTGGEGTRAKDDLKVDPKAGTYTVPGYHSGGPVRIR